MTKKSPLALVAIPLLFWPILSYAEICLHGSDGVPLLPRSKLMQSQSYFGPSEDGFRILDYREHLDLMYNFGYPLDNKLAVSKVTIKTVGFGLTHAFVLESNETVHQLEDIPQVGDFEKSTVTWSIGLAARHPAKSASIRLFFGGDFKTPINTRAIIEEVCVEFGAHLDLGVLVPGATDTQVSMAYRSLLQLLKSQGLIDKSDMEDKVSISKQK